MFLGIKQSYIISNRIIELTYQNTGLGKYDEFSLLEMQRAFCVSFNKERVCVQFNSSSLLYFNCANCISIPDSIAPNANIW